MSAPQNPNAFPACNEANVNGTMGMTLRDWFAGQALIGVGQEYLHRNGFHGDTLFQNLATHSYRIADAMLAARGAS